MCSVSFHNPLLNYKQPIERGCCSYVRANSDGGHKLKTDPIVLFVKRLFKKKRACEQDVMGIKSGGVY